MIIAWAETAWEDYLYRQQTDIKAVKRINRLIKETLRQPHIGIGNPKPLKHNWSGYWSGRIDKEHRLLYKVTQTHLYIVQCRYHY